MRVSRIHIDQPISPGSTLELPVAASHYVSNVLRLGANTKLTLFNGDGYEYSAQIREFQKKSVLVEVMDRLSPVTESGLTTRLGLGISRGERMDYAIQKSTELGVSEIAPLFTENCEVKLSEDRIERRLSHWKQVSISACEQSGRVLVPVIKHPQRFSSWLEQCDADLKLIFDHRAEKPLKSEKPANVVALVIGPEGGFSVAELSQAKSAGFNPVKMGSRVLRTETAAVTVLSVLQYLWGDFQD